MSRSIEQKTVYLYLEALRVISALAVIVVHVSGANWFRIEIGSADWVVQSFFNLGGRFSVCVFCMISGALLLRPREESRYREILTRHVRRILLCLLAWILIYAVIYTLMNHEDGRQFISRLFKLPTHLWYLQMLIGLYLALPVLQYIARNRAVTRCLIWLLIVIGTVQLVSGVTGFFDTMSGESFAFTMWKSFLGNLVNLNYAFVPGYLGFFLLGHYIHEYGLGVWHRRAVHAAIPALLLSAVLTVWLSKLTGKYVYSFMLETNPLLALASAGIFAFFRGEGDAPREEPAATRLQRLTAWLGGNTFGVYLIHYAVWDILAQRFHFDVASYPAIFSVPFNSLLIFGISLALTVLLKKIPGVRRILS